MRLSVGPPRQVQSVVTHPRQTETTEYGYRERRVEPGNPGIASGDGIGQRNRRLQRPDRVYVPQAQVTDRRVA